MVEYSLLQLYGICSSIMDVLEQEGVTPEQAMKYRVRLGPVLPNGNVQFDLGFPHGINGERLKNAYETYNGKKK